MSTLVDQARKWADAIEEGVAHGVYIVGGPADCAAPVLRQLADRVQELESTIQDSLKVADPVQPEKEERRPNCYRKKPVVIEAWQVHPNDGKTRPLPPEWLLTPMIAATRKGDQIVGDVCVRDDGNGLDIHTLEGVMHAATGDWIIRGVKGELYPCKPDIFEATYEPAASSPSMVGREDTTHG